MGDTSLCQDLESLSVSKRLVRSLSQRLKRRHHSEDEVDSSGVSVGCLSMYGRGGGCKVGAETGEEFLDCTIRRRSNVVDEGKRYPVVSGNEHATMDCFSYGRMERFWRRSNRKFIEFRGPQQTGSSMNVFLPDDILEMCLVRLPLTSLMNARLVCRKWRSLTSTPRFMQIRREGLFQSPWLFLFGVVKESYCSGEIHAFDVSLGKWHTIEAEFLKGRYLFSVASIQDDVYIVGGCSSLTNYGRIDRSSFKTHKGVLVFSPLTRSWRKAASMRYSRSSPILGVAEVSSNCVVAKSHQNRSDRRTYRSRIGGASDVYEDPHRLSVRRNADSLFTNTSTRESFRQKPEHSNKKDRRQFILIAVGGLGTWDEPLDTAELYDSESNKWMEIQKMPVELGVACSGVVCNGMFYVYSERDRLAAYDIEKGYWVGIQTTPVPPRVHEYYPKLISCDSRLFMLSVSWCEGDGQIGRRNKAVRKLWELDLSVLTFAEVSTHPDAPMDWNAAFVADKNMIFGVEMFKIFGQVLDFLTMFDVSSNGNYWSHISRNQVAHELDSSSCLTKSMALLHL
ncbi:hypothetical protein Leryth_000694 [Lithospermum erythrorhizon]|nr:hypothetical protein Leryth_000694 [Lithospermum erythrorhizon]